MRREAVNVPRRCVAPSAWRYRLKRRLSIAVLTRGSVREKGPAPAARQALASEEADFTDEFCRFLQEAVTTVDAAELLLVLGREPERAFSAAEAAAALGARYGEPEALRHLDAFRACGLVIVQADGRLRYLPTSEALAAHARTLEKVYRERPVTLIRVSYGLRDSKIRSFAEAFRLRGK